MTIMTPAPQPIEPSQHLVVSEGIFSGSNVKTSEKTIGDLGNIFLDEAARKQMDQSKLVYRVQCHFPERDGTPGGLFMGTTWIQPGLVGNEYFMTRGHFHKLADRGEYYWGLKGTGVLILMDENRNFRAEQMYPGSLHYIPGHTAHRVANTGSTELSFGACWPSDAGYNYEEITNHGFSCRLLQVNGKTTLVASPDKYAAL